MSARQRKPSRSAGEAVGDVSHCSKSLALALTVMKAVRNVERKVEKALVVLFDELGMAQYSPKLWNDF
jgi:hypothetical protein